MKDFEWIIVDALYDQRKDYFKDVDVDFTVKHVPAKPNLWLEKGFPGICNQYNKGIVWSDGDLLFFTGDSHMVRSDFMSCLWDRYLHGFFPVAWYLRDFSFSSPPNVMNKVFLEGDTYINQSKQVTAVRSQTPFPYDILGYAGKDVFLEYRYTDIFEGSSREMVRAPWEWWFGCSSASLEAMLKINGFDEKFDGDQALLDCDVGSRLELAGYKNCLALFRNIFLIRIPTDTSFWNPDLKKSSRITIKCNYPLIWYSRFFNLPKANTYRLTCLHIEWIKNVWCMEHCRIHDLCKKEHPWQYPFEHKEGYPGHFSAKKWFDFWKQHQPIVDLTEERNLRLDDDPKYEEGTFIWKH